MSEPIWEGHFVRHTAEGYVGVHAGFTRLAHLMERPGDLKGVRVELPGGEIRVASERSLERVAPAEFGKYAAQTGVRLTGQMARATAPA
jgi:hypothetical protein